MDFILSALPELAFETTLTICILLFVCVHYLTNQRRIRRLEEKLAQTQSMLAREIKMVNQGAIGVGRRFAQVEKKFAKASDQPAIFHSDELNSDKLASPEPSKFSQIQAQMVKPKTVKRKAILAAKQGLTSKAEQSLTSWLKEHQTA